MRRAAAALVAALLLLAAGCGEDGSSADADDLLRKGFSTDVESGLFGLHVEADLEGPDGAEARVEARASGPFSAYSSTALPELDWELSLDAPGFGFDGRVIATRDNAFVEYGGTTYEFGAKAWQALADEALAEGSLLTFREAGIDPLDWVRDAEAVEEEVDGRSFDRVTGTLDVKAMLDDLRKLLPAAQREDLPSGDQIESVVEDPEFTALIGDDGIWRRLELELDFEVPAGDFDSIGGLESGHVRIEMTLSEPNQEQVIELPESGRPLTELLQELGIAPESLLGPGAQAPQPG